MRPMTGTETGRLLSSSAPPRTLPRVPSITLGVKPRRLLPLPPAESSGSLITSIARARLGRRRMKPRSSSAVMRRWIPDFERRSSASFISSNEGGTPDSFRRSLMNRRSSYCLRVSISTNPKLIVPCNPRPDFDLEVTSRSQKSEAEVRNPKTELRNPEVRNQKPGVQRSRRSRLWTPVFETNHEHTLYVPYVFRNHLISRQRAWISHDGPRGRSGGQPQYLANRPGRRLGSKRCADHKCPCRSQISQQRAVLPVDRGGD